MSLFLKVIVCLHGEPFWSQSFHRIIPLLTARGYRVVAPDFVGFGRSDKYVDWRAYTVDLHKETLVQVLKQLGLDKAGRGHYKVMHFFMPHGSTCYSFINVKLSYALPTHFQLPWLSSKRG